MLMQHTFRLARVKMENGTIEIRQVTTQHWQWGQTYMIPPTPGSLNCRHLTPKDAAPDHDFEVEK